ncbi:hypothetical protein STEG23_031846 [Scotinomys teguina]
MKGYRVVIETLPGLVRRTGVWVPGDSAISSADLGFPAAMRSCVSTPGKVLNQDLQIAPSEWKGINCCVSEVSMGPALLSALMAEVGGALASGLQASPCPVVTAVDDLEPNTTVRETRQPSVSVESVPVMSGCHLPGGSSKSLALTVQIQKRRGLRTAGACKDQPRSSPGEDLAVP